MATTEWDALLAARAATPRRPQVMHQRWEDLLFLHWVVRESDLQRTLPTGLTVHTLGGKAYVVLSPFFLRNLRPPGLPPLPWLFNFLELNVRTYVKDASGVPGIWFYSLDCNQPARGCGLDFPIGSLECEVRETRKSISRVAEQGHVNGHNFEIARQGLRRKRGRDLWNSFCWSCYLFSKRKDSGPLLRVQVKHQPYVFRAAVVDEWSTLPIQQDGFQDIHGAPAHACVVDGFDVQVFGAEKVC